MGANQNHNIKSANGAYGIEGVIWSQHSNRLMEEIIKLFPKEIPIIDLGCGHNFYVSVLDYLGYNAIGCDAVDLQSKLFFLQDLTEPLTRLNGHMNVISLEVAEHIPESGSSNYLDNVSRFGGDVIMSWAIPGQPGVGHISCKDNNWVIQEMGKRKYTIDTHKSAQLRLAVHDCHCSWFKNTLMYFHPKK